MSDSTILSSVGASIQPLQPSVNLSQSLGLSGVCHPKGCKVLVRSNDGFFYPGVVERTSCGNIIFVELVDGCVLKAHYINVIVVGGAGACPLLKIGDLVLVRVRSSFGPHRVNGACDFYIPGAISSLPDGMKPSSAAYSVLGFNKKAVACSRRWIIKISEYMYLESCKYITGVLSHAVSQGSMSSGYSKQFLSGSVFPSISSQPSLMVKSSTAAMYKNNVGSPLTRSLQSGTIQTLSYSAGKHRKTQQVVPDMEVSERFLSKKRQHKVNSSFSTTSGNLASTYSTLQHSKGSRKSYNGDCGTNLRELRDVGTNTDSEDLSLDGQYVLARWPLTGYYFRAVIKQCIGKQLYEVTDANNELAVNIQLHRAHEADIIFDFQEQKETMKVEVGRPVLASIHPRQDCMVPGIVKGISKDGLFHYIQFHDNMKVSVPYLDVFFLDHERYLADVDYLKKVSAASVGCTVIARRNEDGVFPQGRITEQTVPGSTYKIQWEDGKFQVQHIINIFGNMTRSRSFRKGDYLLAPRPERRIYMPATIKYLAHDKFLVDFYDRQKTWIYFMNQHCFWLSSEYYHNAVDFISLRAKRTTT